METPVQPIQSTPTPAPIASTSVTPIPQQLPNLPESNNKKLLLAVLGVLAVAIILAVLIFLNNRNTPTTTNPTPVITDSLPDVAPTPQALTPGATVFEGKMFNVSFEYAGELTDDQTTKVTYTDGTEKCFLEELKGENLTVLLSRGIDCVSDTNESSTGAFKVTSKDGREISVVIVGNDAQNRAIATYSGISEGTEYTLSVNLDGVSEADVKAEITQILETLTYDNIKPLKTDRGDTIVDSGVSN